MLNAVRDYWTTALEMLPSRPGRLILDIINEPAVTVRENTELMREMVAFIRRRNRTIPISVTSAYGDPSHFARVPFFEDDDNIYYQFHFYLPLNFTHQGVYEYPTGQQYPTPRNSPERMRRNLDRVYRFREMYPTAKLLCGEFSCVDFTDPKSRAAWTRDAIIHLRRLKSHWCWHAWREWQHWQPEGETLRVLTANMRK
jgi:endoglucanase